MTEGPGDRRPGRRDVPRQLVLVAIVFVATLVLLGGLLSVAGRSQPVSSLAVLSVSPTVIATATATTPGPAASASAGPTLPGGSAAGSPGASGSAGTSGPPAVSPSPSVGGDDPVLVGAGDIGDCDSPGDEETAAQIMAIPGTVFTAGDDAYPSGTLQQFQDCYGATWGQFKDRTRPAPGNHEWETPGAAGYIAYFGNQATPDGTLWYSYDLGAWHIIVLDSDCSNVGGCGTGSAQGRWLSKDLAASTATCTLAIWHHPRWSSGLHANNRFVDPFWRTLYAAGADVVINGHDHDYERFAPQDPFGDKDAAHGLREFVVGTGGTTLRDFTHTAANSQFRADIDHGVIKLTLHATSYDWSYLPSHGGFSDAGSAACH